MKDSKTIEPQHPSRRWRFVALFVALLLSICRSTQCQSSQPDQEAQKAEPDEPVQKPSLLTALKPQAQATPYRPITPRQRVRWTLTNSIGPAHLAGGVITSALGTALDRPKEYGPHWGGFAERFGIRLTGIVPGNIMEAGLGSVWGEDPRYFMVPHEHFGARVMNVVKQTFTSRRRDGRFAPAYARLIAIPANNFISNAWRPDSEANNHDAVLRSLEGLEGRMAANAFEEFWPGVTKYLFHKIH